MLMAEYECTILDADVDAFVEKLNNLKIAKIGDFFQKRYVYDFEPVNPNSWIRLRTNGVKTTLSVKDIKDKKTIGGIFKLETEVESFTATNEILNRLGYKARNYQENRRVEYSYKDVIIKIDYWPLIPPYIKIEGKNELAVKETLKYLEISEERITTLDVQSIYKDIYNIDLLNIRELRF